MVMWEHRHSCIQKPEHKATHRGRAIKIKIIHGKLPKPHCLFVLPCASYPQTSRSQIAVNVMQ